MKKFFVILSISFLSIFTLSAPVLAFEINTGDNVVITETVLDDMYVLAGGATLEADVLGDLYIMGGSVTINGTISEDLVVAGGRVSVFGDVQGDLRVVGGQVSVYGNVGDDVIMLGGLAEISKDSTITGSVLIGAGSLALEGIVKEDLRGAVGMLVLRGIIEGDVTITIEDTISIYEGAKINGDLNYSAIIETQFPEGVVGGSVNFNQFETEADTGDMTKAFLIYKLITFIAALILVLIFVYLMPHGLLASGQLTKDNVLKCFGVGVLTMIVAFISPIILMMTIVGIPIALILSAMLLIIFYIAKVFVAAWLASYIFNNKKNKKKLVKIKLFLSLVLAIFVYYLLGMIPFVGWFINVILFLIGVGGLMLFKKDIYGFLRNKKMV